MSHQEVTVLPNPAQRQAGHGLRVVPDEPAPDRTVVPGTGPRRAGSAAVVIVGGAGAGKTALLEECAADTSATALWVRGVESEAALPFAAIADLLGPLRRYFDLVPDAQREALEVSLALRAGSSPSPLHTCAGALRVLEAAGAEQRLLVVVDDLQWVDPESRQILLFVARRVTGERVTMVFATRDQPESPTPVTGLRTVRLAVDPSTRAQRLLAAAADAHLAGASGAAQDWCNEALALRSDPCFATDVVLVRGRAHTWLGHPLWAVDDLVRAGDTVVRRDPVRAARLYAEAALSCVVAGRIDDMVEIASRSDTVQCHGEDRPMETDVMSAVAFALTGRCADARQRLEATAGLTVDSRPPWDFQHLIMLGLSRVWLEDFRGARQLLGSVLNAALRATTLAIVPLALAARCELGWWTGDWSAAGTDGEEALRRAEELGQTPAVVHALFFLARLHAARGEETLAEQHIHRASQVAGSYGTDFLPIVVPRVLGLSALTAADHACAADHLDQAWRAARERGLGGTNVIAFGGDLVEAHVRAGDLRRAHNALAWLDERAVATGLVYPAVAAARCHGLLADDLDSARERFARATALHLQVEMPFERARTLLCEGETLRRLRRPVAARAPLLEALAIFESIGARPWAARSEIELAATGVRTRTTSDTGLADLDVLTPQERQVAHSVAEGRNNIEVAASLFVSRKTVEAHLTRIYRKLGVRSRTELARRLALRIRTGA